MADESNKKPEILNTDSFDRKNLLRLVRLKPKDASIVGKFFEEYEKSGGDNFEEEATYLRVKWLNAKTQSPWLNRLAETFVEANENRNAYRCLVESLRNDPLQEDVFQRCESLKKYSKPEYPQKLRENKCTVSVFMTTYNRPKIIKDAINSVLSQTFKDFELIIVNDGATAEVEQSVRSFKDSRIRYFKFERRCGWAAGQNKAISEATGKYVTYLDDDDFYYPEHLEGMVKALERSSNQVIIIRNRVAEGKYENGRFVTQKFHISEPTKVTREKLLCGGLRFGNNTLMHHRGVFAEVGLFDEDLKMGSEDWDMWLRMSLEFDFENVDAATAECRMRNDNASKMNRDRILFSDSLVGSFYSCYMGKIAYAKYFLARGDKIRAGELYEQMKSCYSDYFRTAEGIRELMSIAKQFSDNSFLMRLSKDYFNFGARQWKREVSRDKFLPIVLGAMPKFPQKIWQKVRGIKSPQY